MLRVIRYIFIFILIMLCLFWLDKNGVNVRSGLDKVVNNSKDFFDSIRTAPKATSTKMFDDIKNQDFVGALASTSVNGATTVKAYVKDNDSDKASNARISIDGIIQYTNIERQKAGLKPLIKNLKLNKSADQKVDDMFADQYFEHMSPDGKTAADLVKGVDYKFQVVGENLALGIFSTDKSLVQAWMNSPAHRDNILNPKYTEIGAAVGISEYKGQKQWMAVQHFAKPLPICGIVDEFTQNNINLEKTALEVEERELQKMAGVIETSNSEDLDKDYLNKYNERVSNYNQRLNTLRQLIDDFNKTIVDYNTCLSSN